MRDMDWERIKFCGWRKMSKPRAKRPKSQKMVEHDDLMEQLTQALPPNGPLYEPMPLTPPNAVSIPALDGWITIPNNTITVDGTGLPGPNDFAVVPYVPPQSTCDGVTVTTMTTGGTQTIHYT